uniref:Putative plant transposon protein domain-containing protein n=1 Tax=Cajanus cajan TaxID=3821 RepID=A0A151UF13_CAJCA
MDPDVVEAAICMPGRGFHRNRAQQPLHVKRRDLLPVVRIWSALVHANILPCSHVSDLHWTWSMLMYCIMTQRTVDLGGIICMEISGCANSAPGSALGHPSLIT